MKRIMLAAIATAAVLCSCGKEDAIDNGGKPDSKEFTCTIEDEDATKTTYDLEGYVYWEQNDQIRINGKQYLLTSGDGQRYATFTPYTDAAQDIDGKYYGFYADQNYDGGWSDDRYTLRSAYTYVPNMFRMPMYAVGTTTDLSFKNICGVLALKLNQTCGLNAVNSIVVSSNNRLNGPFEKDMDEYYGITFAGSASEDNQKVTINFEDACGLEAEDYSTFYIPVAPGDHLLTITISDGTNTRAATMKNAFSFARNTVYTMNANDKFEEVTSTFTFYDGSVFGDESSLHKLTYGDGATLELTGNATKDYGKGNAAGTTKITVSGTEHVSIKDSKGAQNTFTAPDGKVIKSVTFYATTNKNGYSGSLYEVGGKELLSPCVITSQMNGAIPTSYKYEFDTEVPSFTFRFVYYQVFFVLYVEYKLND